MKKTAIFALLALCLSASAVEPAPAQAIACDPSAILPWTLQYVTAQYGTTGDHCYPVLGLWACYYGDGRLAALVRSPSTAKVQQQYCSGVSDWYNCPLEGSGACVLTARVRCGGLVGINWRDQCSRIAPVM